MHVHARVDAHACAFAGAGSRSCGCAFARVYMHVLLLYSIIICSGAVCEYACAYVCHWCVYVRRCERVRAHVRTQVRACKGVHVCV